MKDEWPLCGRKVFLSGGSIATSEPETDLVTLWPKTKEGKLVQIKLNSYGSLFSSINKVNLTIVGVEFTTNYGEFIGENPKQFRGYAPQKNIWPNFDATQKWSDISFSSFQLKNEINFDLSNRIAFQLRTINNRLKTLSLAYQNQLNARTLKPDFKIGQRFQDGYTDLVYQEFHSFLFDSGILRDYLCEYVFIFSRESDGKNRDNEVTTASGLLRFLNKKNNHTVLEHYLKKEMGEDGWLYELGNYRNFVMHSAPINIASHKLYAIHESITMPDNNEILSIRFPLPAKPKRLLVVRSSKENSSNYFEKLKELHRVSIEDRGEYDCLEYAHKIFYLLTDLSLEVAELSPNAPMQRVIIRKNN